jgi:hypothetical protein
MTGRVDSVQAMQGRDGTVAYGFIVRDDEGVVRLSLVYETQDEADAAREEMLDVLAHAWVIGPALT